MLGDVLAFDFHREACRLAAFALRDQTKLEAQGASYIRISSMGSSLFEATLFTLVSRASKGRTNKSRNLLGGLPQLWHIPIFQFGCGGSK